MIERPPNTPIEDLAYLVECTLATAEWLDAKTRSPKNELDRQRDLAEHGIICLMHHGYVPDGDRDFRRRCIRVDEIFRLNADRKYGRPIMPWTKDVIDALAQVHRPGTPKRG